MIVGDEQRGDACGCERGADVETQTLAQARVECCERLVENDEVGRRGERSGQRDALLLAARQLVGMTVSEVGEADEFQEFLDACLAVAAETRFVLDITRQLSC